MILYIIGFLVTLFAIHLANLKLLRNDKRVNLGTAIVVSFFTWYGLLFTVAYTLVQGLNIVLQDTEYGAKFKGDL